MCRGEEVTANGAVERPTVASSPEAGEDLIDHRLRGGQRLDVSVGECSEGADVEPEERLERRLVSTAYPFDPFPIFGHEARGARHV